MRTPFTGPRALVAAILLIGALAPVGIQAAAADSNNCQDPIDSYAVTDNIRASTPLAEQFSVSQILHRVVEEDGLDTPYTSRVNGVDAYVEDLGCESFNVPFEVEAWTGPRVAETHPIDVAVQFYDGDLRYLGERTGGEAPSSTVSGEALDRTHYVVVVLEDGPLVSGLDYDRSPPEPYSVHFELQINKP